VKVVALLKVVVSVVAWALWIELAALGAQVLHVPSQFPSISEAVAHASPGAILYVSPGTYSENLVIEIPLSLIGLDGEDEAVRIESNDVSEPIVEVRLSERQGVLIQGLLLVTAGPGACILANGANDAPVTVRCCSFEATGGCETNCIDVVRGNMTVADSTFVGPNKAQRVLDRSNGVFVRADASAIVRDCTFSDFEDSVQTQGGRRLVVQGSRITCSMGGLTVWNDESDETEVIFDRNTILDCVAGITLTGHAASVNITSNRISGSRWLPFRIALPTCPGTEDGTPFTGQIRGRANTVDPPEALCPWEDDPYWPAGFFL